MTEDTQVIRTQELPVLDLGSFLSGDDTNLEDLAGKLCSAAAEFGFFFVKNSNCIGSSYLSKSNLYRFS